MSKIIEQFYQSFAALDAEGMASLYHDEVEFEDPAFGVLKGERARNMWRMLCKSQQGKDFKVFFSKVNENTASATAHWEAIYTFSQTGRKVHNKIDASFEFKDGKIIRHIDRFNLHKWAQQALGFQGALIGWTPFCRTKLQAKTNRLLDKFIQQ